MVNSKKMNKSTVAVVVLALLLVLSLILSATGAWFTDKIDNDTGNTMDFGIIDIEWAQDKEVALSIKERTKGADENTALLMPGDTLKVDATVENKGNAAYVRVEAVLTFDSTVTFTAEEVTALGTNWTRTAANILTYKSAVKAVAAAAQDPLALEVLIPGTTPNDAAQTALTVTVTVAAVQQANVTIDEAPALLDAAVEQTKSYTA